MSDRNGLCVKQLVTAGVRVFFYLEDRERTLDSPTDKIMMLLTAYADDSSARRRASGVRRDAAEGAARHVTGGRLFGYDNLEVAGRPASDRTSCGAGLCVVDACGCCNGGLHVRTSRAAVLAGCARRFYACTRTSAEDADMCGNDLRVRMTTVDQAVMDCDRRDPDAGAWWTR